MIEHIIWLIAGAIIAPLAVLTWRAGRAAERRILRSRRIARDHSLAPAAVDWFQRSGFAANLYRPVCVNGGSPIPMVYDGAVDMIGPVQPQADDYLRLGSPQRREFDVDDGAIKRRQRAGAQLWDGSVLYAEQVEQRPGGRSSMVLGVCSFYSYVTVAERIQTALRNSVGRRSHEFLEQNMSSVERILAAERKPVCVAAATTCLFETGDGPKVLVTERAEEVVNALGTSCVVPTFGLESSVVDGVKSDYGLIFYNFAKEFLEEVYGLEELIRAATSEALDPDAIFTSSKAEGLLTQFASGQADLKVTGMGVEVTDGTVTLALLAHFHSPSFYREVLRLANAGWEIKRADHKKPIEFIAPGDSRLFDLAKIGSMSATSLFSLDHALQYVDELGPQVLEAPRGADPELRAASPRA